MKKSKKTGAKVGAKKADVVKEEEPEEEKELLQPSYMNLTKLSQAKQIIAQTEKVERGEKLDVADVSIAERNARVITKAKGKDLTKVYEVLGGVWYDQHGVKHP